MHFSGGERERERERETEVDTQANAKQKIREYFEHHGTWYVVVVRVPV